MTTTYDPLVWIPVIRAEAYPDAWPADRFPTPRDFPIIDLDIRFLVVDTMVFERLVTLAASTNNRASTTTDLSSICPRRTPEPLAAN